MDGNFLQIFSLHLFFSSRLRVDIELLDLHVSLTRSLSGRCTSATLPDITLAPHITLAFLQGPGVAPQVLQPTNRMIHSHTRTYYYSSVYVNGSTVKVETFDRTRTVLYPAEGAAEEALADTASPPSSPLEQLVAAFGALSLH